MKAARCFVSPLLLLLLCPPGSLAQAQDGDAGGCDVKRARPADVHIPPTWQASFPGSGSRMTRYLIMALTGVKAKNLELFTPRSLGGRGGKDETETKIVAVKTHYPVNNPEGFERVDHLFDRALVTFRNPLNAFPSLFNQKYEVIHKLPTHSVRGPQEDWIDWRERPRGVPQQIERFEGFVSYWMDKWPRDERGDRLLLVSYEDLTDEWIGPAAAGRIAEFFGRVDGVAPVPPEAVPCVWDEVVNFKRNHEGGGGEGGPAVESEDADGGRRRLEVNPHSLRTGPRVRPFTFEELDGIAAMLRRLLERYGDDEFFARTFSSYLETVLNTPVEEGRAIWSWF